MKKYVCSLLVLKGSWQNRIRVMVFNATFNIISVI